MTHPHLRYIATVVFALATMALGQFSSAQERDGGEFDRKGPASQKFWESLSEEDREKLRNALRDVWTDPEVLSAREEVKRAGESFQEAVKEAVAKSDPAVADLIAKAHAASDSDKRRHPGSGGPKKYGQRRSGEIPLGPPGFLEKLPKEKRERFNEVQKQAQSAPSVLAAKSKLEEIQEESEAVRERRMRALWEVRREVLRTMVEIDPELQGFLGRLTEPFRNRDGNKMPSGPPQKKAEERGEKQE